MVALVLDGLVGFPAGLSPTSFHLSPTSFHLSPRLGACGRVPGWLVSHFLSFVSQARCLWSGSRPACLPLLFNCLPVLFICLSGWVLVVGFPAGLSPTSFHLSPTSFHLSPTSFHCLPGWVLEVLVSHFFSFVSHFFSFVSLVGFPAGLSPTSFHLSPRLGACGRVPGRLVSHFLSFFVSQVCHWWCPPLSVGHTAFLFRPVTGGVAFLLICLPGPSVLVPCSISIHLSFRSVTGGVQPCVLAMKHFYSFVS